MVLILSEINFPRTALRTVYILPLLKESARGARHSTLTILLFRLGKQSFDRSGPGRDRKQNTGPLANCAIDFEAATEHFRPLANQLQPQAVALLD